VSETEPNERRLAAGRAVGLGSAAATLVLLALFRFANPYATPPPEATFPLVVLAVLALVATLASLVGRPIALGVAFALSFYPIGFNFLMSGNLFALVGIAQLGYLAASILLWPLVSQRESR